MTTAPNWRARGANGRFTKLRWWQKLARALLVKVLG